jgi:DNA-binding protein H-NS
MAERGTGDSVVDWLEIDLHKLSGEERVGLILEIIETLNAQELRTILNRTEQNRQGKLKVARSAVIAEMRAKFAEVDLSLEDVLAMAEPKKGRKVASPKAKYRSPEGEEWSGRGRKPRWAMKLESEGKTIEEFLIKENE